MNYEASDFEKQILGLIITSYGAIAQAQTMLPDETPFSGSDEKKVYAALLAMHKAGIEVDLMNTNHYLTTHVAKLDSVNHPWIARLTTYAGAAKAATGSLTYKCQVLWQEYARAEVGRIATNLITESMQGADSFEMVDRGIKSLTAIVNRVASLSDVPFSAALKEAARLSKAAYLGEVPGGLQTGIDELDTTLKGLQPATLTIMAGRPAMGKSAEAAQIAYNIAVKDQKGVAFFSLEMVNLQTARRFLAIDTLVRNAEIPVGCNKHNEPVDFEALEQSAERQGCAPLYVYDKLRTLPQLRAKCLQLASQKKVELFIIDYLQLIKTGTKLDNNHYDRVTEVSRELKEIAILTNTPVLALAQLSRAIENRANKRPMMADLKESGAIEQDADNIVFLYRPAYYASKDEHGYPIDERLLHNIVAKNRNGSTHNDEQSIELEYDMSTNRIKSYPTRDNRTDF